MNSSNEFLREMTAIVPALRGFGRSLCANRSWADDLVQETMLKAWSGRDRFQPGSNMKAWLLTILRNQYYSELRHRKFEVEDPDDELASRVTVQPEHEALSTLEAVAIALKTMPTEQREALLLVCASGLSYRQAAVVCHCAIGTIKSRIARARDHLLEFLGLDESHTSRFDGSSHQHPRAPYGNATLFKRSALFPSARA